MTLAQVKRPYDRTSNVLIVDDDDTLLKFFKIHLNKFFSRVIVVENAKQAIDSIKGKDIDLVLTDVRMPKVDGLQLMQKLKKSYPQLPVLLISGEPMNDDQQKLLDESDGFLSKPFSVDQLNNFIHYGIDLRQAFKDLAPFVKDDKNLRKTLHASDRELAELVHKKDFEAAQAICVQWRSKFSSKTAA